MIYLRGIVYLGNSIMPYYEAIRKLRHSMYLTQTEFGSIFGVTFGTVNRWENGKFEPSLRVKRKLAFYFKKYNIEVVD